MLCYILPASTLVPTSAITSDKDYVSSRSFTLLLQGELTLSLTSLYIPRNSEHRIRLQLVIRDFIPNAYCRELK